MCACVTRYLPVRVAHRPQKSPTFIELSLDVACTHMGKLGMDFFTDIDSRVRAIQELVGEVADPAGLPSTVERLDNAAAVMLLELTSGFGQTVERLRAAAVGVIPLAQHDAISRGLGQPPQVVDAAASATLPDRYPCRLRLRRRVLWRVLPHGCDL